MREKQAIHKQLILTDPPLGVWQVPKRGILSALHDTADCDN